MAKLAEDFMEQQIGLRVFDELIPTLMYMDDAAILVDDRAQLQKMLLDGVMSGGGGYDYIYIKDEVNGN